MKTCMAVTVDRGIFRKIEQLRGREKRSSFVEYLIQLGINEHQKRAVRENSSSVATKQRGGEEA